MRFRITQLKGRHFNNTFPIFQRRNCIFCVDNSQFKFFFCALVTIICNHSDLVLHFNKLINNMNKPNLKMDGKYMFFQNKAINQIYLR